MSDHPPAAPPGAIQLQIEIDPAVATGTFVNMAMLHHTDSEFTIDLLYVAPHPPKATVRTRAITTPRHAKRLLLALQENIARYEARFGAIELGDAPQFPGAVN